MSEQQPPAKLLEGLLLGEPISSHHGVRCCPAIREGSDDRYMVKIISIPATQSQLDALLLTGACADEDQALSYFKELAQGVADEAHVLRKLSGLEGFVAHEEFELRQMPHGIGYEIYLLSPYRRSLAELMRRDPLTHLAAVNLGLDLCAALTACRRLGYLYVDLKPENVFFKENQGYRIGDLGFLSLASVPYASLPEKYRSRYTAPEISDALSSLNSTMDIYALGLILYPVYNHGQFPFEGSAPDSPLPAPMYADYEMAEIIAKACAPDPHDRWQDPAQMGQALVNYMQRNSVNATPIIPPLVLTAPAEEFSEGFLSEEENDAQMAQLLSALPEEIDPEQLAMDGSTQSLAVEPAEPEDAEPHPPAEEDENQLSFLDYLTDDETAPSPDASAALEGAEVTEEVAEMLALADDLIAHELPEPVVAPGPIDVAVPPPAPEEPEDSPEEPVADISAAMEEAAASEEEQVPYDTGDAYIYDLPPHRRAGRWIALVTAILLLLAGAVGGYIWYQECFLQSVDALNIQGQGTELTVTLITDTDETLLSVVCTDTYGNTLRSDVVGGVAHFTGLTPATQYRIRVDISGLHRLTGSINGIYTTEAQTEILNFTAVSGPEDGSAILNFSLNGPDCSKWTVHISAPGETERAQDFSGHTATVYGLTPGTAYIFRLDAGEDSSLSGQTETTFTAQKLYTAQDLQITDCGSGSLTVQWARGDAPADQVWLLRCYNGAGYDQSITTTDLTYTFSGLDHSTGYTVLVTAEGMPQSVSASVTANPIQVTGYTATALTPYSLAVEWAFTGAAPENGWVLTYSLNGEAYTVNCPENNTILALVSGGIYDFTARPADDITCYTQSDSYTASQVQYFEGFGIASDNLTASLVLRPEGDNWGYGDLTAESYKNEFSIDERAAVLLNVDTNFTLSADPVTIVFALRDDSAQLISPEQHTSKWNSLWTGTHCTLELPVMPQDPGSYTLDLYFNDLLVTTLHFSMV